MHQESRGNMQVETYSLQSKGLQPVKLGVVKVNRSGRIFKIIYNTM